MRDIPDAIVESARPPLRPAFRKALIVAVIAVAGGAGWQLVARSLRSDASKELEARQDRARASIGSGLDALFAHQLEVGSTSIELAMTLDGGDTQAGYTAAHCSVGFDNAFSEALGSGVVSFSTVAIAPVPSSRLVITAKLAPSGQEFWIPSTNVRYAGLVLNADMTFLGTTVHADVVPISDPQLEHYQLGVSPPHTSMTDVEGSVIERVCGQAAYTLLEALTTWKRPAPPPRPDPVKECDDGFHCVDNAEVLAATDRATAARLLARACDRNADVYACSRAADLEMELAIGNDDHRARAHAILDGACDKQLYGACAAAARIALVPVAPGELVSPQQQHDSLVYAVRACDIGDVGACYTAAELLANTRFADAAPLLTGSDWTASRTFGTIFAVRPGEWAKRGSPTIWATRSPVPVPDGATVTSVAADHVPAGIDVPEGANTVYAVTIVAGPVELTRSR